jgi:thiol-disulfide isomerase/thioredoxin
VSFEAWQTELKALEGQIVVVDMWATWCLPCIERFPHMVQLADEYSDRGVEFISMCLDDRDDKDSVDLAQRFLTEKQARFTNYLMDEVVTQAFEKLDLLGIPAVLIYGPSGDLRYRLTGDDPNNQFTDADVNNAIEELLANG